MTTHLEEKIIKGLTIVRKRQKDVVDIADFRRYHRLDFWIVVNETKTHRLSTAIWKQASWQHFEL